MTAAEHFGATTAVPEPAQILSDLIRFDTQNPPGNEGPCIQYIKNLLEGAGYECSLIAKDPARPNLICRVKGQGSGPPLLMYGHVDVVPTTAQEWQVPPFEGRVVDGVLWGRGAIDMKGPLAMMISALLRARAEGRTFPTDVIFAALSDEEAGRQLRRPIPCGRAIPTCSLGLSTGSESLEQPRSTSRGPASTPS